MLAVAIFAGTACTESPAPVPVKWVEGDLLPPFLMETLDGGKVSLEAYGNRVVLLNVWATWCAPCRKELPSLQRLSERLDPERFAVVGLAVDSDDHQVREYLLDKGIGLTSFIDRDRNIARDMLGAKVYPDTFVIAPGYRYVHHVVGDRVWDTPQMVAALEAVYAGQGAANLRAAAGVKGVSKELSAPR